VGKLFSLAGLSITEVAQIFGLLLSTEKVENGFWQKMDWATFWAIFSQTHQATLLALHTQRQHDVRK
jgi:ascorbate-specific PTS system EIIC-type component UlaA